MKASPLAAIFSIAPSAFCGDGGDEPSRAPATMRELRDEVERWGEQYIPAFTGADIDAIADWLDRNFFRLTK